MMDDVFWYVIVPFGWELMILGLLFMLSALVHRWQRLRADRRAIMQRLEQVKRDLHAWKCWRCKMYFDSEQRPRPLCLCNECLDMYMQEVA